MTLKFFSWMNLPAVSTLWQDEPLKTINKLADIGKTIIITTHFMEEAEYCTKMAIQAAGRMLALGSPAEIKKIAGLNNTDSMDEAFLRIVENDRKGSKS